MREKITAIVPAYNEEHNIRRCLESLQWVDEILVVDSYSTDRTVEIAREMGAKVLQHEYINSAKQKNWAIPRAENPWILVVDCDEVVTPELREEIEEVLSSPAGYGGFYIPRKNIFLGKEIKHCGWAPQDDLNLRLFRKDSGRYEERWVHADVIISGGLRVGRLKSPFTHNSYRSLKHYLAKAERYTDWAAAELLERGARVGASHIALRPMATFFKMYLFKMGFLDGFHGLLLSALSSYYVLLKYAKAWDLSRQKEGFSGR